jgi:hypothetical protein
MSPGPPLRPALVVNRLFMQEFLAAEPPCFALGLVEERQRLCGMLALRLDQEMPAAVADGGFEFGHALFGNTTFAVLHLVFAFLGFQTYNVLINPSNPLVQAVLRTMLDDGEYFFFALNAQGHVTAFRADIGVEGLAVLRANRARLQQATTTGEQSSRPSRRSPPIPIWQGSSSSGSVEILSPLLT